MLTLVLKGVVLGVFALAIDYFFIGFAFHRYQALTPQIWRAEGTRQYTAATTVDVLFGLGFAFFFSSYRTSLHMESMGGAVAAGVIFWALFTLPVLLSVGIFVNWHKAVWFALVADWLVIVTGVSLFAFFLI